MKENSYLYILKKTLTLIVTLSVFALITVSLTTRANGQTLTYGCGYFIYVSSQCSLSW